MNQENQQIVFSLEEINEILKFLGEIPAKYSLDLIAFIRGKAQEQIKTVNQTTNVDEETKSE